MKEYYIFNLKKEFAKLYKERPSELFYIFNRIYYMKEVDKNYGYNLFEQICNFIDKKEINEYLYNIYKDKMMYSYNFYRTDTSEETFQFCQILQYKTCH